MKIESASIDFLYNTVPGRTILKILVQPALSKAAAFWFSSGISSRIVPSFMNSNNIDPDLFECPDGGYSSFNDFFTRKKKKEFTNIEEGKLVCPCDALLTVSHIDENTMFDIKHCKYSAASLLKDGMLATEFIGGTAYVFRLTPSHYHRYNFCTSGKLTLSRSIKGILHSVKPVCHEHFQVFVQNSRKYVSIKNDSLGDVIQMEVGALLVGKVSNHPAHKNMEVTTALEKGYFEYGGSSIVVLTKANAELPEKLLSRESINGEIPVSLGECLIP
jgi:phosphatidylserine decarboxylase